MKLIPLTQGLFTQVDDDVYEWASKFKWYALRNRGNIYAARGINVGGKVKILMLHRIILKAAPGTLVDHRDGDGLNNLGTNIRLCSHAQNSQNKKIRKDNTSGYRGVWLHKRLNKYTSQITAKGQEYHLGYFDTAFEAACAYDTAALRLHGDFARLNFPSP